MVLKRLEVFGFKSFAERTIVEFPAGITAIVGPNGCGKSNVSDSIRWVLGEQSAKSLRGGKMEDVIFSGTTRRPPLGFSEVVLTFDNTKKLFPLEFSEVSIGRRLFRSGESSYTVNKKECRLRDVYDLLMDSGIGRRAHSIIEQGKIDEIVTAKPEERRVIIEEAAGIAKYRSRRAEALRKLKSAEEGLRRVDDLIAELERQQMSLRRSAKKAEKYKEVQDELKSLEIVSARFKGSTINNDLKSISQEYTGLQTEIVEAESASGAISVSIAKLDNEIASLREALGKSGAEVSEAEREVSSAEARLEETMTRFNDDGRTIENLSQELGLLENRIAVEAEEKRQSEICARESAERLIEADREKNAAVAVLDERAAEVARLVEAEKALTLKYAELSEGLVRRESEKAHIASASETAEQRRREAIARRAQLLGERELLEETLRELNVETITVDSDLARAWDEKRKLSASVDELSRRIKSSSGDMTSRERELAVMASRFESASADAAEHIDELKRVAAECGIEDFDLLGLINGQSVIPAEYAPAFSAALGDAIHGVLVFGEGDLSAATTRLAEQLKGRVVVPSTRTCRSGSDRSGSSEVAGVTELRSLLPDSTPSGVFSLLAGWYLVETAADAREICEGLAETDRIVTLSGDVFYPFGAVRQAGGSESDELISGRENLRGRINVAEVEIESLRKSIAGDVESKVALIERLRATVARASELETRAGELRSRVAGLRERLDGDNLSDLEAGIISSQEECRRGEERSAVLFTEITEVEAERKQVESDLTSQSSAIADSRESQDAARQELSRIDNDVNLTRERVESQRQAAVSIERRLEDTRKTGERYTAMVSELKARREESAALIELFRKKTADISIQLEEKRSVFKRIESELTDATHDLGRHQDSYRQTLKKKEDASNRIHGLDVRKVELSGEWRHIVERIREKYEIDISAETGEVPAVSSEDEDRLEELRSILGRMGAVNFAAAEELGDVDNRLTFYHAQRNDLARAESDLGQVVREIDEKTVSLFHETFNAVNTNFGLLFKRLFSGTADQQGSAELVLLDPSNPLESGIDIIAMPPGKKPQSISLLSGGEKAMTAISLLFAVFLVRPSPFAILDELDAPLDEANVERFARILREFSQRSQFIVVTHNKRTMEVANTLYGVAMPERGVSNIFGVRLSEAEELSEAVG